MNMARTRDMTQGRPAWLIFSFALPLMLGSICQQLYTMVDTAIVGRFVGIEALAAVGACDWVIWLVLGVVSGLTQGFSILIAQRFGAGDLRGMRRAVASSALLSAGVALVLTPVCQVLARPTLLMMGTPENIFDQAEIYMRAYFAGTVVVLGYNLLASVLRAVGDGRTPLIAMLVASAVNVALDLLFVAGFHWGVGGAAAATVISQAFSMIYCLVRVCRLDALRGLKRSDFCWDGALAAQLSRLAAPLALQNAIIALGGMALQSVINAFGFIFVAGFTATNKLYGLIELAAISFGYAMATFAGQNLGAGQLKRIRQGVRSATWIALLTAAGVGGIALLCGRGILSLFIDMNAEQASEVLNIAMRYLTYMSVFLPALYMLHIYRSALQGMGDTLMPMVSGIVELFMRVGAALALTRIMGQDGLYYAEVSAWTGAAVLLVLAYFRRIRALERGERTLGSVGGCQGC